MILALDSDKERKVDLYFVSPTSAGEYLLTPRLCQHSLQCTLHTLHPIFLSRYLFCINNTHIMSGVANEYFQCKPEKEKDVSAVQRLCGVYFQLFGTFLRNHQQIYFASAPWREVNLLMSRLCQ